MSSSMAMGDSKVTLSSKTTSIGVAGSVEPETNASFMTLADADGDADAPHKAGPTEKFTTSSL
jgi:hypothetical protein